MRVLIWTQLGFIIALACVLGWLGAGRSVVFESREFSIVYWLGALLFSWSVFFFWTIFIGLLSWRLRLPNIVIMSLGAVLALFPTRFWFYEYLNWMGIDRPWQPIFHLSDIGLTLEMMAGQIYASAIFIFLWGVSNFVSWSLLHSEQATLQQRLQGFLCSRQYWLFGALRGEAPSNDMSTDRVLLKSTLLDSRVQCGDIYALKAEDHYVKIYHRSGETLIHARLKDAISEVGRAVEGLQVHRSWWVRRDHVTDENDAQLKWICLKDGLEVPVSRTFRVRVQDVINT